MDEDQLGQTVDAWLASLRAQGLSGRRLGELASLLGQAMGASGPQNTQEERVVRRFEKWRQTRLRETPPA